MVLLCITEPVIRFCNTQENVFSCPAGVAPSAGQVLQLVIKNERNHVD